MKSTIQIRNRIFGEGIPWIAVPIMARTTDEASSRCSAAVEAGADMIELRADVLSETEEAGALTAYLRACREAAHDVPLLFTVRTGAEGGEYKGNADAYEGILRCAIDSGCADLIDIELSNPKAGELLAAAHKAGRKTILSFHNFDETPCFEELKSSLRKMEALGGDAAKIACMPKSDADVCLLLALSAWAKRSLSIPSLVIAMGERGALSRLAAETFGSAMSFACLRGEASAPGQYEVRELREKLLEQHWLCEERKKRPVIFLTGFMGSGKSSVGRRIAKQTGLPLIEMDEAIAYEAGKSIPEIFEQEGEQAFRDMETKLLVSFWENPGAVVSCGGGVVIKEENRELMHALGTVVLLQTSPEAVLRRLKGSAAGRPNLRGRMTVEGVEELMERRQAAYEAAADICLKTDDLSAQGVCEAICNKLSLA